MATGSMASAPTEPLAKGCAAPITIPAAASATLNPVDKALRSANGFDIIVNVLSPTGLDAKVAAAGRTDAAVAVETAHQPLERAAVKHANRVRRWTSGYILTMSIVALGLVLANLAVSVYAVVAQLPLFRVAGTSAMDLSLILVPRVVVILIALVSLVPFMQLLAAYREEPDLYLPEFMPVTEYPTVSLSHSCPSARFLLV